MTTYIQVPVPEEYVPKVFELIARLDRGESDAESPTVDEPAPDLDETLVKRMYDESFEAHKALLELLAKEAGNWLYTSELAEALELEHGSKSAAGMFGAFGRRSAHRYGGAKPWGIEWDRERGEAKYRMKPEVAAWVNEAAAS